ncbi:hypothetical protein HYH03_014185 [Edaphochlamys debaryana]|uniref:YchJ-like middle NTF2-like domain-containing protein n=1 Tax=Edaphochlamys debaryana TaxID=47281 RepID=A0A836BS81_9CHLO|nr:hypothetical protein HYH03_014185 [Edaphochlamys debaryana]|eukprot:KAG2487211.1 hypothetical protein HYH03_014185 [Edaphochlamys debaryana]
MLRHASATGASARVTDRLGAPSPAVRPRLPIPAVRGTCTNTQPENPAAVPRFSIVAAAGAKSAKAAGAAGAKAGKGFGAAKAPPAQDTCACGSKKVYRECCEPYHSGAAAPADVEAALRARFCAFVKGRVPYLVSTFHPLYHSFKYEGSAPGGSMDQLRRDVEAATKRFTYSALKVLEVAPGSHPDESFITFRYNSINKVNPERNVDGSVKVGTTVERSRFLRDPAVGPGWRFADYELIDYPTWMEEAKQAEQRARGAVVEGAGAGAASS